MDRAVDHLRFQAIKRFTKTSLGYISQLLLNPHNLSHFLLFTTILSCHYSCPSGKKKFLITFLMAAFSLDVSVPGPWSYVCWLNDTAYWRIDGKEPSLKLLKTPVPFLLWQVCRKGHFETCVIGSGQKRRDASFGDILGYARLLRGSGFSQVTNKLWSGYYVVGTWSDYKVYYVGLNLPAIVTRCVLHTGMQLSEISSFYKAASWRMNWGPTNMLHKVL